MATVIKEVSQIKSSKVRLVSNEGSQILDLGEALLRATSEGLDLVLLQDGDIPVVKLCDFTKIEYEKQKNIKHNRPKKAKQILLGPHTQEYDMNRFAKQASDFIKEGHPVSVRLEVRGRDKMFENLIREKIQRFASLVQGAKPGRIGKSDNGCFYTMSLT